MLLREYAERHWMPAVKRYAKSRTIESYLGTLERDILPALGGRDLITLARRDIKTFLLGLGKGKATVAKCRMILSAIFSAAVEDEIVDANPCAHLGKSLRLGGQKGSAQAGKAMDAAQLGHFLDTARAMAQAGTLRPVYPPLFATLALAGLRPGEGLALQKADFTGTQLVVRRTWAAKVCGSPKTGKERVVEVRPVLADLLRAYLEHAGASPWIFTLRRHAEAKPVSISALQKAYKRVLKAAELPIHLHPHSMRHSFASQLLAKGESPQFVQRQLGHASISMTVDVYGSALPVQRTTTGVLE